LSWKVGFTRKAEKQVSKLPQKQRDFLELLVIDIQANGPVRTDWQNYSKLGPGEHHCHLSFRYVACWRVIDDRVQIVEVYYAGTREGAPY
jgi:mRNA-degrading endonuclease RelE of RelBE toxin-antitoxin system